MKKLFFLLALLSTAVFASSDPSILPNNGVLPVLGQLRADPFVLNVQNDGNVVVSKTSGAGVGVVWQTLTGGHVCSPSSPQQCVSGLMMQGDGNLVLYGPNGAVWWNSFQHPSQYGGVAPFYLQLQSGDGNLVVRDSTGQAVWSTGAYRPTPPSCSDGYHGCPDYACDVSTGNPHCQMCNSMARYSNRFVTCPHCVTCDSGYMPQFHGDLHFCYAAVTGCVPICPTPIANCVSQVKQSNGECMCLQCAPGFSFPPLYVNAAPFCIVTPPPTPTPAPICYCYQIASCMHDCETVAYACQQSCAPTDGACQSQCTTAKNNCEKTYIPEPCKQG